MVEPRIQRSPCRMDGSGGGGSSGSTTPHITRLPRDDGSPCAGSVCEGLPADCVVATANITILVFLVAVVFSVVIGVPWLAILTGSCALLALLVYLACLLDTATYAFLCNQRLSESDSLEAYASRVRNSRPTVMVILECWKTTTSRHERRSTPSGPTRWETSTHKHTTYRATRSLPIHDVEDTSCTDVQIDGSSFSLVQVFSTCTIECGDEETRTALAKLEAELRAEGKKRGEKMSVAVERSISCLVPSQVVAVSGKTLSPLLSRQGFWVAAALLVACCYMRWFRSKVGQTRLHFEKRVFLRDTQPHPPIIQVDVVGEVR